jgi:TDG/mug DNA glycosylase family protein
MAVDNSRSATRLRSARALPDVIRPGVRVLFVGINPGLRSAVVGHHFAGHSNRFWKLLSDSQLAPERIDWRDDVRLPEWGFGITNLVKRATAGISDLQPSDFLAGRRTLFSKVRRFQPEIVALVGVTLFRSLFSKVDYCGLGLQTVRVSSTKVFVLPNPSGRNANFSYDEMLNAFRALRTALT